MDNGNPNPLTPLSSLSKFRTLNSFNVGDDNPPPPLSFLSKLWTFLLLMMVIHPPFLPSQSWKFFCCFFFQPSQLLQLMPPLSFKPKLVNYFQLSFHQPPFDPIPFFNCCSWFSIFTIFFPHLLFYWYISFICCQVVIFFSAIVKLFFKLLPFFQVLLPSFICCIVYCSTTLPFPQ